LHCVMDAIKSCTALIGNTAQFLEAIRSNMKDPKKMETNLNLAVKALTFAQQQMNQKVQAMSKAANHTSAKKSAEQAHRKLSKNNRQREKDQQLERNVLMTQNPQKTLDLSLKQTREAVASLGSKRALPEPTNSVDVDADEPRPLLPRKQANTTTDGSGEAQKKVISITRPANRKLYYAPQEVVDHCYNIDQDPSISRTDKKLFKEKMIETGCVPCQMSQLNKLIAKHGGPGKPKVKPSWNSKGAEEIMSIDELHTLYKEHQKRQGKVWQIENTKQALTTLWKKWQLFSCRFNTCLFYHK